MATGNFTLKQVNQAIAQGAWSGYIAPRWVEYLVVAGAGSGGGGGGGGGGGAGGLLTGIVTVAAGTSYTVTVGAGGTGVTVVSSVNGNSGAASVFGSISAAGGGGGGLGGGGQNLGVAGGSGGGAGFSNSNLPAPGGQGTSGQGNAGGLSSTSGGNPGGGGGAGTVGLNGTVGSAGKPAGNGGVGIASAISGTVTTYAGGGGGGGRTDTGQLAGSGGIGGGGAGGSDSSGTNGAVNTGGGGGGVSNGSDTYTSGAGGSGIVVVRYPGNVQFYTGGTVNYANGYIIHIFTASGTLAPTAPTVFSTSYQISRSLRFNRADTNTLTRTPTSAGSRTTYSLSFWIKNPFSSGNDNPLWGQSSISRESLAFSGFTYSHNPIVWIPFTGFEYITTQGFRDNSAWYHVVAVGDSTNATAGDRARLYINGSRVTAFAASPTITQNSQTGQLNTAVLHYIGQQWSGDGGLTGFYLAEMHFIDGQALTAASFGATDPTTGVWAPIQYTGTYGTNGFKLNFSDNSNATAATLGADSSGNGNNWAPNSFSVTAGAGNDSLVDTPTPYGFDTGVGGQVRGNYCTLNPVTGSATLSNGNLVYTSASGAYYATIGTIGVSSGKWYWEMTANGAGQVVGICGVTNRGQTGVYVGSTADSYGYYGLAGNKLNNASSTSYGSGYTSNDVIGVALDLDAGTLVFYKNNTSQGTAFSSLSGTFLPMASNDSTNAGAGTFNFGQRPFAYTAPSGFKALCSQNLPTPAIGGSSETLANKFFDVNTWTGNGTSQTITNTSGFQPDWVWLKSRSSGTNNHNLFDVLRGATKHLFSNTTAAEGTNAQSLTAFTSTGFSVGNDNDVNQSSGTYVGWQWKANGAGASNSAGSITSTVSANQRSGFSVVTYTGNSTNGATIGHGLGVAPVFVIVKSRNDTFDWIVWSKSFATNSTTAFLNTTDAAGAYSVWSSTLPSSTVITLPSSSYVNGTSKTYVAYCFAPVAGYSAFGSYTGNGSTNGPFIYTGFRPAFLLIKNISSAGQYWDIYDSKRNTANPETLRLFPNASDAEGSATQFDFLSNGFKVIASSTSSNGNGDSIIYMAFAENPFKYSLAR
jgi:hypothetical protein